MARKSGLLYTGEITVIRSATAIIAADSATLTDANIPAAGAIDCTGFDSIFLGIEVTAGTNPTMTLELLFRDAEAADGARWKRFLLGARDGVTLGALAAETSGALDGASLVEMRCFGHALVYPRITAVTNSGSTTAWKILALPGKTRNRVGLNR